MGTNKIGDGMARVSLVLPLRLKQELTRLAKSSPGVSLNEYCSAVLEAAAEEGKTAHKRIDLVAPESEEIRRRPASKGSPLPHK